MKTYLVAEIGCNHQGKESLALQLARAAVECGADFVKSQKRCPETCLTEAQKLAPYQGPHSFGPTYLEHREALELPIAAHQRIADRMKALGAGYALSVWDNVSLSEAMTISPPYMKIPSAMNENRRLLETVAGTWPGEVHVSNGMLGRAGEERLVKLFGSRLVLYACTSKYPSEPHEICLLDVKRLNESYPEIRAVGFSGHHKGIALDIAAAALGARYIERHFTLDRTWKGTDHAASLERTGLRKLARDLVALGAAWREREGILSCEMECVEKLKPRE